MATYKQLEGIVKAVSGAAASHLKEAGKERPQRFFYINNPDKTPASTHRSSASRPDGYFLTYDPEEDPRSNKPRWWDIGLVGEFKCSSSVTARADNLHKVIWGMNQIMRDDPLRRAAWGFTIEKTTVRLWYCDRSQVVCSTLFDFFKDPRYLVKFFLSILFTDPCSVGWDPTISRIESEVAHADIAKEASEPPCQYDIEVHQMVDGNVVTVVYCTLKLLFHVAADGILGRGTRVWSAYPADADPTEDNIVAIKDGWLDVNRTREGNARGRIRKAVEDRNDANLSRILEQHFLHTVAHGDVLVAGAPDTTPVLGGIEPIEVLNLMQTISPSRSESSSHPSSHYSESSYVDQAVPKTLQRGQRVHYRIVSQEVGTALHDETSLSTAFKAIRDVKNCLMMLHECGWMHRDISSGNILVYKGRGLLTDFEYAKSWSEYNQPGHPMRTGTQYFMSVEVDTQTYEFEVKDESDSEDESPVEYPPRTTIFDLVAHLRIDDQPRTKKVKTPFRYHLLNDWESLWWVSAYMLIDRTISEAKGAHLVLSEHKLRLQRTLARSLFYVYKERRKALNTGSSDTFEETLLDCIHDELVDVAGHLNAIREGLVRAYTKVEKTLPQPPNPTRSLFLASKLTSYYFDKMYECLQHDSKKDIVITRLPKEGA